MSIFNRHKYKIFLVAAILVMAAGGAIFSGRLQAGQTAQASAWAQRCNANDASKCEIYWRSSMPETGQRIAEFAIGFPDDKKSARGVMILPLGILLTEDVQMQIDDGLAFKFKVKFCDPNGCVAYLNVSDQVLSAMRKGTAASVKLKSANGQAVQIDIPLSGFSKTLETLS